MELFFEFDYICGDNEANRDILDEFTEGKVPL